MLIRDPEPLQAAPNRLSSYLHLDFKRIPTLIGPQACLSAHSARRRGIWRSRQGKYSNILCVSTSACTIQRVVTSFDVNQDHVQRHSAPSRLFGLNVQHQLGCTSFRLFRLSAQDRDPRGETS
ncbi:hypothetical protein BV25DRAFT_430619 [Artomyces pyxidatus]|uniref:Uncharacterized protein n=1 Tax=Artomyces pyxidatus TaxID=48021 RepID=A0ACB8T3X1_9AGAM|nr:hypothetical protein BV25DRAFT_430619 [Artomyces pyxidatus]